MKVLTCEQRGFVTHKSGAFVTACPGSGKTTAIVERVARLAETLPPRRGIALLSFTNTAVNEFRRGLLRYGITRGVLEHPGFVGTFDRFIIRFLFEPVSLRNQSMKLNVVPSWGDLNVKVRLAGKKATWRYQGVPLNAFRPATGELILEEVAGSPSFLAHVAAHKGEYEEEARRKRQQLLQSGLISVADVRVEILKILRFEKWARTVSEALSSRFYEMIIDEAQDCNELDYEIIRWLRRANLRISVVGDPDQAIYEFRGATPGELLRLGNEFPEKSRLSFTGNFRSSPIICALAATLRPNRNPDTALGKSKDVRIPIQLVAYTGRSPECVNPF